MSKRKKLEIRITGDRQAGKSVVSQIISRALKEHGINHEIVSASELPLRSVNMKTILTPEVVNFMSEEVDIKIMDDDKNDNKFHEVVKNITFVQSDSGLGVYRLTLGFGNLEELQNAHSTFLPKKTDDLYKTIAESFPNSTVSTFSSKKT